MGSNTGDIQQGCGSLVMAAAGVTMGSLVMVETGVTTGSLVKVTAAAGVVEITGV